MLENIKVLEMEPIVEEDRRLFEGRLSVGEEVTAKAVEDNGILEDLEHDHDEEEDCCLDATELVTTLPDEVWIKILAFLTNYELCLVSRTCKELLRLTRDPLLWRHVSLVGDAVSSTTTVTELFTR